MKIILNILDHSGTKATFFVLGWVVERYGDLIKGIAERGHEIASHGYEHELVDHLGPNRFRDDLLKGIDSLTGITRLPVLGYRAPSFSMTSRTEWAFQILTEAGIRYDSSVYPVRRRRGGISDAPLAPYDIETPSGSIREFPIAVFKVGRMRFPLGGGGYFRLYPYWVTATAFRTLNARGIPVVFYLHPWEVDPDQPIPPGTMLWQRWKHRVNLRSTEHKFRRLLNEFQFQPLYRGLS